MTTKIIVAAIFIAILASLGSGLFFLIRDKGRSDRTVKALTMRVCISIGLLGLLIVLWWLGIIQPHGVRP
ncbi:twin transmembrane helix small protein [Thioalkalivibrio sp. HK1]|uniref:twin transmembrane helix small protein n=1 Tax=Thioalkalivibrio sp. HK1 TaxID=1469245 RepID=UPI0004704CA4|nr:twin transmembrane helix small protein [Thioalkalivibrio sp. HK1]